MIRHRSLHRCVFLLAGCYNVAWGLLCIAHPRWMRRLAGRSTDSEELVSALGLVIGLYGPLYLGIARAPERGLSVAAVGLAGKVIGPVGVARAVLRRSAPRSTFLICVTNDFVWWIPFGLYLRDVLRSGRSEARDGYQSLSQPSHL